VVAVYGATELCVSSGKSFVYAAASCIQPFHNALKCKPASQQLSADASARSQEAEEHGRAYRERYHLEERPPICLSPWYHLHSRRRLLTLAARCDACCVLLILSLPPRVLMPPTVQVSPTPRTPSHAKGCMHAIS
jgi:hypothetical protein